MARPPHEDPEYQRQIVGTFRQNILSMSMTQQVQVNNLSITHPPIAHHNYSWSQQSPVNILCCKDVHHNGVNHIICHT